MKQIKIILIGFLILSLAACHHYEKLDYTIADHSVYYESHGACEMFIMSILSEDETNTYYLTSSGCEVGHYYYIQVGSKKIPIEQAVEDSIITLDDCLNADLPFLRVDPK